MLEDRRRLLRDTERWLRREGMPATVRGDREVLARTAPAAVFLAVFFLFAAGVYAIVAAAAGDAADAVDRATDDGGPALAGFVGVAVVAAVAAWAVRRRVRDGRGRWRRPAGTLVPLSVPLVGVVWGFAVGSVADGAATAAQYLATLLAVALLVWAEVTSLVAWAARQAVRRFSDVVRLTSRALPLLLLFVTFLFINTENWQVAAALTRPQLWGVAAFFVGCLLLFLAATLPGELARTGTVEDDPPSLRQACHGTPLAPVVDELLAGGPVVRVPLRGPERLTLLATTVLRLAIQAGLVGLVVWVFFVLFGKLAIRDEVIESWTGRVPEPGVLFPGTLAVELPVSQQLIQVSVILGAFSALYFGIYAVTDPGYRAQFLDDVLEEVGRTGQVRDGYLALRDRP